MKQHSFILAFCLFVYSNYVWSFGSETPELIKQTAQLIKLVNFAKQQYKEMLKTQKFIEQMKDIESIRDIPLEYIENEDLRVFMKDMGDLEDKYENPYQYPDNQVITFRKNIKSKWKKFDYKRSKLYIDRLDEQSKRIKNIDKVEKTTNKNYRKSINNNTERDATNITATSTAFLANAAAQKQKEDEQKKLFNVNQHAEMEKTIKDTEKLYGAMGALGKGN